MLLASASVGASKFGATAKLSAPVELLRLNFAASAPPVLVQVSVVPGSGSLAAMVVTAVVFSGMLCVALVVMAGAVSTVRNAVEVNAEDNAKPSASCAA